MPDALKIAVVDYGMGNLFSVQQACETTGMQATLTSSPHDLDAADGIILPGVGAFGNAMETLTRLKLVESLRANASAGKPLMGICLGMQLLMDHSEEFGKHPGLGLISGSVIQFPSSSETGERLKVPQMQWNQVYPFYPSNPSRQTDWSSSPLHDLPGGVYMYFVHSYYVVPDHEEVCLASSQYGPIRYCSSLLKGNIFACQFHPERSGSEGLHLYRNFADFVRRTQKESHGHVY